MNNKPFLTNNDGWDKEQLANTGLLDLLQAFSKVSYELMNCRRGSYAISGDTAQDLIDDLSLMRDQLDDVITIISEVTLTEQLIN